MKGNTKPQKPNTQEAANLKLQAFERASEMGLGDLELIWRYGLDFGV